MDTYYIYKHTAPNGKVYIGQTKQKPEYRWNNGNGYTRNKYLGNAIAKYGWDNFDHEILDTASTADEANEKERAYITKYKANDRQYGYNLTSGGHTGYELTEDVRKRLSEIHKGVKPSLETRQKRSESLKKFYSTHTVGEETRAKLRISGGKNGRPVVQYTIDGDVVAEYSSALKASEAMNLSENAVRNCILGRCRTCGGYVWRYKGNPYIPSVADAKKAKDCANKKRRMVVQLTLDGEIVNIYESMREAQNATGIDYRNISAVCRGEWNIAHGYRWRYADGNESKVC